ncbi:hypothetical protein DSM106972_098790 [Dulcicalothrix desertica PCC 7102]|uniref:Bacteriocin n=1 Tax=Dulcicalothrix desertica PCC 7102 TaxID=232991 RepID=A0A3S1BP21_9CYAN|nr:hypothetical protein [Dulcicalothrix desertica]RUS92546.1 hypothetical protein DSM106972_098790 [Dulcicalothrix desertica PCC 7102]TWH62693.1 hypothetical protein CAL7102_00202 [Dulcicalothrix desertica PCC 7102]
MTQTTNNHIAIELSSDELDTVAGGFVSTEELSKSISDSLKLPNFTIPKINFGNYNTSASYYQNGDKKESAVAVD